MQGGGGARFRVRRLAAVQTMTQPYVPACLGHPPSVSCQWPPSPPNFHCHARAAPTQRVEVAPCAADHDAAASQPSPRPLCCSSALASPSRQVRYASSSMSWKARGGCLETEPGSHGSCFTQGPRQVDTHLEQLSLLRALGALALGRPKLVAETIDGSWNAWNDRLENGTIGVVSWSSTSAPARRLRNITNMSWFLVAVKTELGVGWSRPRGLPHRCPCTPLLRCHPTPVERGFSTP